MRKCTLQDIGNMVAPSYHFTKKVNKTKMEKAEITLKEARELYKASNIQEFLLSKFTKEQLEGGLTTCFDDLIGKMGYHINLISEVVKSGVTCSGDKHTYPTIELAEAALAQSQLAMHMREYNGDWVADWNDNTTKWVMYFGRDKIVKDTTLGFRNFFTFKNEELRDKFLENHRDLIEKYRPLA